MFAFLVKQAAHLPAEDTRIACLNLLPHLPNHIGVFERAFGLLPDTEKNRVLALAAESSGDWRRAETHWCAAAVLFRRDGARSGILSAAVIYRHLADLARKHGEIEGEDFEQGPAAFYLKQSLDVDPDHLPALLQLIDLYRADGDDKAWHALAEAAVRRFPRDSAVLLRAIDAAAARKAYKKAAGFAQNLLVLDPINQPARQRMIDLQIAQARKQMRSKRPDLAWKELAAAAQWERDGSPNAVLHINQGLVGLRLTQGASAEAGLREGVTLAGGSVAGWFHAALNEVLLLPTGQAHHPIVRDELARMLKREPDRPQITAIVSALDTSDVRGAHKATAALASRFGSWVRTATGLPIPAAEFHALADVLLRAQLFDVLGEFAHAAQRREPDEPAWRFYAIVARTRNNPDWMDEAEDDELVRMQGQATGPRDFPWFNRIQRYIDSSGDDPEAKRRARRLARSGSSLDDEAMMGVLETMLGGVSPDDVVHLIEKHGKDQAVDRLCDRLVHSPLGALMPRSALEDMARTMIDMAQGNAH